MELTNDFRVALPVDRAWAVLTDVERIAPCMPGAQLQEIEGDDYRGVVKIKVGPITAQYKGQATFLERDEANHRAVLRAEGRETRGQGNANATITATLTPDSGGTAVTVVTDLTVTGRVAQFGRGVLADVSAKLLGQFVDCLEQTVLADEPAPKPKPKSKSKQKATATTAAKATKATTTSPPPAKVAADADAARPAAKPSAPAPAPAASAPAPEPATSEPAPPTAPLEPAPSGEQRARRFPPPQPSTQPRPVAEPADEPKPAPPAGEVPPPTDVVPADDAPAARGPVPPPTDEPSPTDAPRTTPPVDPASPPTATPAAERPAIRKVDMPEPEAVDILGAAGAPLARRAGPVLAVIAVLWVLKKLIRRRR